MEWAREYYTKQSQTFAAGDITAAHRAIAARLHQWCQAIDGCRRVLELGAGMGGTAAALATYGYEVHAVEFNPSDAELARRVATTNATGSVTVVQDDFYLVRFDDRFDFIYYWDGFGVGDDADQHRLLTRIGTEWLVPAGRAVIDVYSPWNWQRRDGETSVYEARDGTRWERRIEFDANRCRFIDHWEPLPHRDEHRSQTLRCYTPTEFEFLVQGTGLRVEGLFGIDGRRLDEAGGQAEHSEYLAQTNGFMVLLGREDERLHSRPNPRNTRSTGIERL